MKFLKKILSITLCLLMLSSCGYKIVNQNSSIKISSFEINGDNKIKRKLENNFSRYLDTKDYNKTVDIKANAKISRQVASKDKSGNEISYSLEAEVELYINENDPSTSDKVLFKKNTFFNALESKFEQKKYEQLKSIELIELIIVDINNYLNDY